MNDLLTIEELKAAADPGSYRAELTEGSGIMKHYFCIDGVGLEGQSNYERGESEVYAVQTRYLQESALVRALVRLRDGVAKDEQQGDGK